MVLTDKECESLRELSGHCANRLMQEGASSVLIIMGAAQQEQWSLFYSQRGSSFESDGLVEKWRKDRDYQHHARRLADTIQPRDPPDDSEVWKSPP